jgi:PAS domain S-box-containing protein
MHPPPPVTILIVDDFEPNRKLLNALFSHEGFEVREAGDGAEGLRVLERGKVDVVVSDILMPNMDGYRLCAEMRRQARLREVPFVFHTSTDTSPGDEALALELGADLFIRKPVPGRILIGSIYELLKGPRPDRTLAEPPEDPDLRAEYTQRLVGKLEEKNKELFERTEEARRTGDKLSALILVAPVAIVSVDAEGVIRTWNGAAEQIFGWTAAEALGRRPGEVGFDPGGGLKPLDALESDGMPGIELTLQRRDKSTVHVELSAAPLYDGDGTVSGRLAIFVDITKRKQAEEALEKARSRMEILSRRLLATAEAESRRIARELHDGIGQGLTAAKMEIEAAKRMSDPAGLSLRLDDAIAVIEELLHSVRALSLDLRPASLDELGLVAALRAHVQGQAVRAGLRMLFEADELPGHRDPEAEIACFRVAQEALTNIIRHANATWVQMELRSQEGGVRLVVQDNGTGFDTVAANAGTERGISFGLLSMRERAQLAGGTFLCTSEAGLGTRIEAFFPAGPGV